MFEKEKKNKPAVDVMVAVGKPKPNMPPDLGSPDEPDEPMEHAEPDADDFGGESDGDADNMGGDDSAPEMVAQRAQEIVSAVPEFGAFLRAFCEKLRSAGEYDGGEPQEY